MNEHDTTDYPLPLPLRAARGVARGILGEDYRRVQIGLTERRHLLAWRRSPVRPVTDAYVERLGLEVAAGPFAGTVFPDETVGFVDGLVSKLVGSYERELHPAVEATVAEDHDALVNFGCADGLYAVGLARRMPDLRVFAYDLLPTARRICRAVARHNGVLDRFAMGGLADIEALRALPVRNPVVVADCEGAELELIDPDAVPWLRDATILVEFHDFAAPRASTIIPERFAATHDVQVLKAEPRYISEYPVLAEVTDSPIEQELALLEFRPAPMSWGVMRPRVS